ncbi:hypothetical protein ONZ43_g5716 [Nemania bipapillata]|uniref:Uncharacterized protein n=1 Tax=Nemania bipapillata TaxID=110536 RepID=A0ACC2I799_9PEZI|nr:hypothetical protein ONZ43_g5716 [Nemania bipapillata]
MTPRGRFDRVRNQVLNPGVILTRHNRHLTKYQKLIVSLAFSNRRYLFRIHRSVIYGDPKSLLELPHASATKKEAGYAYLTYQAGEIFDVIGEKGELWLAKNQDDPSNEVGWLWSKHFAKLADD